MSFISLLFLLFSLSCQQQDSDNGSKRSISLEKRIIGGKNAVQADWKFIGSVKSWTYKRYGGTFFYLVTWRLILVRFKYISCGATVLTSKWIVTATHCLFDSDNNEFDLQDLTFIVGDYNTKTDSDDLGDFQAMISNVHIHNIIWYNLYDIILIGVQVESI